MTDWRVWDRVRPDAAKGRFYRWRAVTRLVTKKDYGPWFERYLLGSEWPPLEKPKAN